MKTKTLLISILTALLLATGNDLSAQDECMECHNDPEWTIVNEAEEEVSMYVDIEKYAASIHGQLEFACVDCHFDAEEIPHAEALQKVECGMCHGDAQEEYERSIHSEAWEEGIAEAATCSDCHGKHDILPTSDPQSRVHPLKVAFTCAVCHSDPQVAKKYNIPISDPLQAYRNSVHGVALLSEENFDAATCTSCHGSHDIRRMGNPDSQIFWKNVAENCGQCHGEITEQYVESVHGEAVEQGIRQAPTCTDCHGEHRVMETQDPKSPVHPLRVAAATCERCHASELITQRFGMAESRVTTFEDSYHGLAIKGGSLAAANCASCHGIHNILPSSDPKSMVHPDNLQATCGSCHKGATANFAKGPVHLTTSTTPGRVVKIVEDVYIWLIVIVIGGMVIHNGLDFIRRSKRKVEQREHT